MGRNGEVEGGDLWVDFVYSRKAREYYISSGSRVVYILQGLTRGQGEIVCVTNETGLTRAIKGCVSFFEIARKSQLDVYCRGITALRR